MPSGTVEKVVIPVSGMTCAACQARVQRALSKTPGVVDAAVNLMMNSATVSYDPAATQPEALIGAIQDVGYGATLPVAESEARGAEDNQEIEQRREFTTLRLKAIVSGVAGVIAMLLSMPLMTAAEGHASADPFMAWAGRTISPAIAAVFPGLFGLSRGTITAILLV